MINNEIMLVRKAQTDYGAAWEELIRNYYDDIYRMMLYDTGNEEDARQLVQDVFLAARRHLRRLRKLSSFSDWLRSIARKRRDSLLGQRYRYQAFVPGYTYVSAARRESTKDDPVRIAEFEGILNGRSVAEFLPPPPYGRRVLAVLRQMKRLTELYSDLEGEALRTAAYDAATEELIGQRDNDAEDFDAARDGIRKAFTVWEKTPKRVQFVSYVSRRGFIIGVGASAASLGFGDLANAFEVTKVSAPDLAVRQFSATGSEKITRLMQLANVRDTAELLHVLSGQDWSYSTASLARQVLASAKDPTRILRLGLPLIHGGGNTHGNVLGFIGILMNSCESWITSRSELNFLTRMCEHVLKSGNPSSLPWIESLVLGVAKRGRSSVYLDYLQLIIEDSSWNARDAETNLSYYGSVGANLRAIKRHMAERRGPRLTKIDDVGSIMQFAALAKSGFDGGISARRTLSNMVTTTAKVLANAGEPGLAQTVLKSLSV